MSFVHKIVFLSNFYLFNELERELWFCLEMRYTLSRDSHCFLWFTRTFSWLEILYWRHIFSVPFCCVILFALQNVENVDTNKQIKSQEADEMWPVGLIEKIGSDFFLWHFMRWMKPKVIDFRKQWLESGHPPHFEVKNFVHAKKCYKLGNFLVELFKKHKNDFISVSVIGRSLGKK